VIKIKLENLDELIGEYEKLLSEQETRLANSLAEDKGWRKLRRESEETKNTLLSLKKKRLDLHTELQINNPEA